MNLFDKNKISDDYSYAIFPDDFRVHDQSQIIFAPNGTGKTTLFNILCNQHKNDCEIFSYNSNTEPTFKDVNSNKKTIVISPMPKRYEAAKQNASLICEKLKFKDLLKNLYNQSSKANIKKNINDDEIIKCIDEDVITFFEPLSDEQRKHAERILKYENDILTIIKNRDELLSLDDSSIKNETKFLKMLDDVALFQNFDVEKNKNKIEEYGCPLCGRHDDRVYEDIINNKKKIDEAKKSIFRNCEFVRDFDEESFSSIANTAIQFVKSLSEKQMVSLLMSKGNKDKESEIIETVNSFKREKENMDQCIKECEIAFSKMYEASSFIKDNFPIKYPGTKVEFDQNNKNIIIKTARYTKTYSEGEKHDMYTLIRELSIIGGDKTLVIADDPVTDLDTSNIYKSVFRFIQMAANHQKHVVVFTCNPDFINIANEQMHSTFEKYYMTSHKTANNISIEILKMDLPNNQGTGPYLSLKQIMNNDQNDINNFVVHVVKERADLDLIGKHINKWNKMSKYLHYDKKSSIGIEINGCYIKRSNSELASLIEDFSDAPKCTSFSELARSRVTYLAALRVYIEKKIHDYDAARKKRSFGSCFEKNKIPHKLYEKIKAVDEIKGKFPITKYYPNWDRRTLMSIKTMLNDNDHPYSQVTPLTFAISLDDNSLVGEINIIKKIFNRN